MRAAAFFDLDHTLISRSTPLALASSFHRRGLIRRSDILRAAVWQLVFLLRGVGEEAVRKAACDGMVLLKGIPVSEIEVLLGDAMERVLSPLVYAEPLTLREQHHRRGEPVYILSAIRTPTFAFLEAVGNPVAVNPDRKLRAIARARRWPVLTFSKPPRRVTACQSRPRWKPGQRKPIRPGGSRHRSQEDG